MMSYCEGHQTLCRQGTTFVTTVKDLMQLLLEYRAVVNDSDNRDSMMCCTVSLLASLHSTDKSHFICYYQLNVSVKEPNISIYLIYFFFRPSLSGVLFPMFCCGVSDFNVLKYY